MKQFAWNCRRWILNTVIQLANYLDKRWRPQQFSPSLGGKVLRFDVAGRNLGRPVFHVVSMKGDFYMGAIEWSNQWNRPRFKADPEAIFDQQCVAEIYAKMRDFK